MPDRIRHILCHDGLTVLDNYVYVLGTGSSLLNLSKREREYLHQHPRTLAINRYYLYYEKLGILPKMLFVADFNYFADLIVRAAIERLNAKGHEIPFYVNQAYIDFYTTPWYTYPLFKRRARHMLRRRYRYTPPADLPEYYRLRGFSVANECTEFKWAANLGESLYHRRGSLSSALNLINILYPGYHVKLLGIDLSTPGYFYEDAITQSNRDHWVDEKHQESIELGSHACARPKHHDPVTLIDVVAWICAEFDRQGLQMLNCNPNSLLVTERVTPRAPVIGHP